MNSFEEWASALPDETSQDIMSWLKDRLDAVEDEDYEALSSEFMLGVASN